MRNEPSAWLIGALIVIGDRTADAQGAGLYLRAAVGLALVIAFIYAKNSAK